MTLLFVGAPVAYYVGKVSGKVSGIFSILVSLTSFILILANFSGNVRLASVFSFSINDLTMFVALVPAFMSFLVLIYSLEFTKEKAGEYYCFSLLFTGSMVGVAVSWDLLWLYIFIELTTISSAVLILYYRRNSSLEAALKYIFQCTLAGFIALAGILILYLQTGTLYLSCLYNTQLQGMLFKTALALIVIGFGVKVPLILLHTWLPDAFSEAPSPVGALLAVSTIKLSPYVVLIPLIRIVYHAYGVLSPVNHFLAWIGAGAMLVGVFMALLQRDVKRLLSYHIISQMGYMVMGVSLGTPLGIIGGLFHSLNHAIYKGLLYLCAGSVEHATGETNLDRLGGLARHMPITAVTMTIASLSISGIPPFSGFSSKWIIYEACIQAGAPLLAGVGMLVSALTLISFMKVIHSIFLSLPGKLSNVKEVSPLMYIPMVILASLCILFGVVPGFPLSYLIVPATTMLVRGEVQLVASLFFLVTDVGSWYAAWGAFLLFFGVVVIFAIYKLTAKPLKYPPTSDKFLPFTGGLVTPPYLKVEEAKVSSSPFSFAAYPILRVVRAIHTGFLPHYLLYIVVLTLMMLFTFTMV
ncbi:MAG: complex I subunit 5 family protein [Candidatus Bathyarchaeota archaeon]